MIIFWEYSEGTVERICCQKRRKKKQAKGMPIFRAQMIVLQFTETGKTERIGLWMRKVFGARLWTY